MSDTTQRLCTNHIVRFRSFLVYILYGFFRRRVRIAGGRFWCAACNSVNRTCSTSTLFCVISLNSVAKGPITSKWLKIDLYCLRHKCSPKNLVFRAIYYLSQYLQRLRRTSALSRGSCAIWIHSPFQC